MRVLRAEVHITAQGNKMNNDNMSLENGVRCARSLLSQGIVQVLYRLLTVKYLSSCSISPGYTESSAR